MIVQVVKEPTGHKGPRVTTAISIPGRFLVLMPQEKGINVSKKISSAKERARLKSVVSVMKPPGVGVIIRTEAEGQSEEEIKEDLELLLESWNNVITAADTVTPPNLLHRDQDLLYKVIREACTEEIEEIIVDTPFAYHRAQQLLQSWNMNSKINLSLHKEKESILITHKIDREIRNALQTKVTLPCGGYLFIQTTEALTVVDVNSGKFVSSATQAETIKKTNLESVDEIARQLRLRNIGGMIIIDFIDMDNRVDQITVLEHLEMSLEPDKSNPQIGQISDLGLVELTRHRQGQSLSEIFTKKCPTCAGNGQVIEEFNFVVPPAEAEMAAKMQKVKHFKPGKSHDSGKKQKGSYGKKFNTSPALNAANAQKAAKQKQDDKKVEKVTGEKIKQTLEEETKANLSQVVKVSAVPAEIATNKLGKDYQPDVFTMLDKVESAEKQAKEAVKKAPNVTEQKEAPTVAEQKEAPKAEEKEEAAKPVARTRRTTGVRKTTTRKSTGTRKTTKKTEE